jgi:sulfur carrier protein ThiS
VVFGLAAIEWRSFAEESVHMQITVHSFGAIQSLLGQKTQQVELPEGGSVRDAIDKLLEKGGARARKLILSADGKNLKIIVMLDGKAVVPETTLQDGQEINLMLTIGGGA